MRREDWDRRYLERELLWSAEPNRFVAEELADLPPGTALDLACGEGRNAIWLAARGWRVTAVDFSPVAIGKAAALAERAGVTVQWAVADLLDLLPDEPADLVLVAYLQLPREQMEVVLRMAQRALRPGGTLFLVGHDLRNLTEGVGGPGDPANLHTPEHLAGVLDELTVTRAGRVDRPTPDGTAIDTIVRAVRPANGCAIN
ncbi:MAG TPA: class I SAM-dependent methyltransferase [Pseudonocardiaceae bacterium]